MPDTTDDPRNPFDPARDRIVKWAAVIVLFVVLPLALAAANRGWL